MALLDRFRAQPRQKHADAAVRLAFVQELPITERELLSEIVREDSDARVRRAAAAKLLDPAALATVARDDADEGVRQQAAAMLRDLALEAFEGAGEAEALASVDALSDMKAVAVVAKSAPSAAVAERALARVQVAGAPGVDENAHVVGSIARHAEHESVRRAAFASLIDHAELLGVALNSEFREPAVSAVDRISERDQLEQIAARAKNKSASKRARAVLREMDERAAQSAALEAARRQEEVQAASQEQAERDRAAETAAAAEAAARAAAKQRDAEDRARAARAAAQEAAGREGERRASRLAELADEAERVAAVEDVRAARRQFAVIRREWADISGGADRVDIDAAVAAKYAEADARFSARETSAHDLDQRQRRDTLVRLQQLASRVEALAAREDLTLKAGGRALRDLRVALQAIPPLPSRQDYETISTRLKAAQAALTPKVQELRNVADWQRWANVGIQEQLCEKMEALKALDDPEAIIRHVRDLQQQWRQAADVPRPQGEQLWKRFKAAHDEVWAKCEAYFAAQSEERAANLAKKEALVARAEGLAESTRWIQTADEIKSLQAEWKTIGPVTRGQEKAIWDRFRGACDRFFQRRHADLAERKTAWAENFTKKEALCVRAEDLSQSTDWEAAASQIRALQAEWKAIGPVKKSRSEAIWQRFRAACDAFFTRYAQRHDIARGERVAAREAIVAELEGLTVASPESPVPSPESPVPSPESPVPSPADVLAKVRDIRSRWQRELAQRGVDRERATTLDARFAAAFTAVVTAHPTVFGGTDLDPDANRKRMDALVKKMEDLAESLAGPGARVDESLSPTTRLATMLRDALAANTIGGKVDDDQRLRAAADEVRQAQATWSRIGPVPDDTRRALADRFQRAIRRISDRSGAGVPGGAGR
ncbi:MAG TPA: DUF349 domain-containing protein [Vicinamibacterales bacterium]|nr:DUF349 domain-containing protein [Vicinamibacterales bacterium]